MAQFRGIFAFTSPHNLGHLRIQFQITHAHLKQVRAARYLTVVL